MMGVCFLVEEVKDMEEESLKNEETKEESGSPNTIKEAYGPLTGQLMSTMKDACLESYLGASPRLIEGVYLCYIQTDSAFYGKTFDLLNKRRAIILEENLNENSNYFNITAHLPVQESMGFYTEMMIKTSGRSNAQLFFDNWRIVEVDPFFAPETEEVFYLLGFLILHFKFYKELEEFGEQALMPNLAKQLIDKTRRRKVFKFLFNIYCKTFFDLKGILTEEKIVVAAEKQRTLSKKK
jgi:ribosome assembly protein 1